MSPLLPIITKTLTELSDLLTNLSNAEYSQPCQAMSNATIGEHTRHILELFRCLESQYSSGEVNYDNRKRDQRMQTQTTFAKENIEKIISNLDKPNKNLCLVQKVNQQELLIESNYHRELLYNLEHCIHHQALIKVALNQISTLEVNDNFGVAPSTIEYRKQCVQ